LGLERRELGRFVVHPDWRYPDGPLGPEEGEEVQEGIRQRLSEEGFNDSWHLVDWFVGCGEVLFFFFISFREIQFGGIRDEGVVSNNIGYQIGCSQNYTNYREFDVLEFPSVVSRDKRRVQEITGRAVR
jgi:hypothetical protein